MPNSLKEIETALTSLWMNQEARESFLADKSTAGLQTDVLEQIDRSGISLYSELLNIGHQDVIESIYPHCATILGKKWSDIVDHYLSIYPPNHYNLNRTAERFPQYIEKYAQEYKERYPYLAELADYEWIELEILEKAVRFEKQAMQIPATPGDFIKLRPILNPTIIVRHYNYPILHIVSQIEAHAKAPKKVKPEATSVAVYRDPETKRCKFIALGKAAAHIIESCRQSDKSYSELLKLAITDNPNTNPEKTAADFLGLLEQFQNLNVFVGSAAT